MPVAAAERLERVHPRRFTCCRALSRSCCCNMSTSGSCGVGELLLLLVWIQLSWLMGDGVDWCKMKDDMLGTN